MKQPHCPICGVTGPLHGHHVIFRSQGGTDDDSNIVHICPSCHEAVHQRKLAIKELPASGWSFMPLHDDFDANRPHICKHGSWYPFVFHDEVRDEVFPDSEVDEELAHLSHSEYTRRRKEAEWWRMRVDDVARAFALCERSQFKEWREESGIAAHDASKMLLVAAFLERRDLRDVPQRIQVLAAKAVKAGRDYSEVTADAAVLSESDCKVRWFDAPEPAEKKECPTCHSRVPKERLEEEK